MISIIILTFNSIDFIRSCLDSVFAQNVNEIEVIVVDNGSRDNTVSFIKEKYPQVSLIENKKNVGAAKARNQGIDIARGEWILVLDCDVVLKIDFLSRLLEAIKIAPAYVGMIQPKMLNFDKRTIYSCGIYLSWLRRFYDIGKGRNENGQFDKPKYVFGACSAAALYKREMLEAIKEDTGYFDERFFFLVEDVDLSWRAQREGWKVIFSPRAICFHSGNSSHTGKKIREYFCFRNRYLMIRKNESSSGKLKLAILSSWYELSRGLYLLFTNRYIWNRRKTIQINY